MRLRLGINDSIPVEAMKDSLDAALEASTASQVPLIRHGKVPGFLKALRARGIRWRPEPPGDEHFDSALTVLKRGWGDCDDLAPWHAATLRATGEDPHAIAEVKRSGPNRWHAIVRRSDGDYEDPSRAAGMGQHVSGARGYAGVRPYWAPMFADLRSGVAVHPWRGGYVSRVDVPDMELPAAWSGVYTARQPQHAVVGAVCGVLDLADCAGDIDEYEADRLGALCDLLEGADPEDVAETIAQVYGDEEAVGFLPALLPAASMLAPAAGKLLSSFGGGGGGRGRGGAITPSAAVAQPPAMGPGTTMCMPGGTTIVRF